MARKLASIQKVLSIDPIPDADNIEKITINGWTVVSKKGNFKVGDLGVFYEVDSVPPDIELYKFLWADRVESLEDPRPPKYRLKSKKLRGQLSQGLMLSLDDVLDAHNINVGVDFIPAVGTDLTDMLTIQKYEPPELAAEFDGDWPFDAYGCGKTDELRLQSAPGLLDELRGNAYVITEKADGQSVTIGMTDDGLKIANRSKSIAPNQDSFWNLIPKYNLTEFFDKYPDIILQGEFVGPGIEQNKLNLKDKEFHVFNMFDKYDHKQLPYTELLSIAQDHPVLKLVKRVTTGERFDFTQEQLLEMAEGKYEGTTNHREGLVVRPLHREMKSAYTDNGRLSFKVINNIYLLKEKD